MTSKLLEVSVKLEQSLSKIPYEDLDISDEVREQVNKFSDPRRGGRCLITEEDVYYLFDVKLEYQLIDHEFLKSVYSYWT